MASRHLRRLGLSLGVCAVATANTACGTSSDPQDCRVDTVNMGLEGTLTIEGQARHISSTSTVLDDGSSDNFHPFSADILDAAAAAPAHLTWVMEGLQFTLKAPVSQGEDVRVTGLTWISGWGVVDVGASSDARVRYLAGPRKLFRDGGSPSLEPPSPRDATGIIRVLETSPLRLEIDAVLEEARVAFLGTMRFSQSVGRDPACN